MWLYNDELLIMLGTLTLAPRIINFPVAVFYFFAMYTQKFNDARN